MKKNLAVSEISSTFAPAFERKSGVFPLKESIRLFGVWRSWLAHLHGVQGVESSSLFTPTIFLYTSLFPYLFPLLAALSAKPTAHHAKSCKSCRFFPLRGSRSRLRREIYQIISNPTYICLICFNLLDFCSKSTLISHFSKRRRGGSRRWRRSIPLGPHSRFSAGV